MLVQISGKLSESNLEDLKYLLEPEGIPLKDLEEATSGTKLFQLLQYRGVSWNMQYLSSSVVHYHLPTVMSMESQTRGKCCTFGAMLCNRCWDVMMLL